MRSIITLLLVSGCSVNSDSVGSSLPSIEELPGSVEAVAMGCRTTYFRDVDHDGFGDRRKAKIACSAPVGYVKVSGDCDDRDSLRNPNAAEVCDGIDQNCNGSADESAVDASTWYVDTDKDGHGDATISAQSCSAPSGYVAASDDCNDSDAATYVGAPETCDGRDNNCDNTVDNQPVDGAPAYVDADGDGFGLDTGAGAMVVCHLEPGFTGLAGDCNDADASISPSAPEICDLVDQNCNGIADDNAMGAPPWFADKDQDGHGDPATVVLSCSPPPNYVGIQEADDCDDRDDSIFPGAPETCDQIDQDCNKVPDNNPIDGRVFYADIDQDGFGDPLNAIMDCTMPADTSLNQLDCDDTDMLQPAVVDLSGMKGASGTLADPATSIQEMVDGGRACIVLASGTYQEDLDLSGYQGSISSISGDAVIEGLGDGPAIRIDGASVTLKGLIITGGGVSSEWVYDEGDNNAGVCTGALESTGGGLSITNSTVALSEVTIRDNDITGGTAPRPECVNVMESWGGGIYADHSILTMDAVTFAGNIADNGAAMMVQQSTVEAQRVMVTGMPQEVETDIMVEASSFTVANILLAGPASTGLYSSNSTVSLSQALVAGYDTGWQANDHASVVNSIFMDNGVAMDGEAAWDVSYSDSYNNGSNWPAITGIGLLSVDPELSGWSNDGDATNDNFVLKASSPAIDAGKPGTLDVDGTAADLGPLGGEMGW